MSLNVSVMSSQYGGLSAIEVTALVKNLLSEMKDVQEKESVMGVRGR